MADSTPTSRARRKARQVAPGFTLFELLVAVGLSATILAGVLTATVQLARSSARITAYAEMDTQVRRAFETLASDLRSASYVTLNSTSDLTVTVPRSDGSSSTYTYAWNSTDQILYRVPGASSSNQAGRINLIRGIPLAAGGSPGVAFSRLNTSGTAASSDQATKSIKVTLTVKRTGGGATLASSTVTATFLLRNKAAS